MLRTLFICYSYLSGNGGGIYAARTHINLFAEVSDTMTLLFPYKKGKDPEGVTKKNIVFIPIKDTRSKLKKGIDYCVGKVHRYVDIISEYVKPDLYDLVVFDNSVVSSSIIALFKNAGIKTITIHHNYQIEYLLGDSSFITLMPKLLWTRIYEKQAVKISDLNITLTKEDADLLASHYDTKAKFAVLGVYEYQHKNFVLNNKDNRGNKYIITGSLQTKQTEDSLISWIKIYYPILKLVNPNAELTIAGREPSSKLSSIIHSAGIQLIASPSNMLPILQEHDYYICPTDRGGGLKLRIMDGLKAGLPVLTHSVSARGYEKLAGEGILFSYNNIESFKEGVKALHNISENHQNIQRKYMLLYNFNAGVIKLRNILSKNIISNS